MLVNHRFEDRPYFTVVDRARTQELMREYGRSLRGEIDPSTAVRFGKQIGAEGVYFGNVAGADISTRRYTAKESYCTRTNSSGKCKDWGTREVSCREQIATVTLVPRLVNVETGRVVYRSESAGIVNSSACGGDSGVADELLLEEATARAVAKIRADIAPNEVLTRVELMEEPSSLDSAATAEFDRGLAFAKEQRMDRACQIWDQLSARTKGVDNALLYNIAVCAETEGNYEDALNLFEQLDQRLLQPDENVSNALQHLKSTLAAQ
jgi:curli biogenesis system outer membrane secretion channel CsgG